MAESSIHFLVFVTTITMDLLLPSIENSPPLLQLRPLPLVMDPGSLAEIVTTGGVSSFLENLTSYSRCYSHC